jgi:hypothetical protein
MALNLAVSPLSRTWQYTAYGFISLLALASIFFLGGLLQEEFSWRGKALELLRSKFDTLVAPIIVGLEGGVMLAWIFTKTETCIFAATLDYVMFFGLTRCFRPWNPTPLV